MDEIVIETGITLSGVSAIEHGQNSRSDMNIAALDLRPVRGESVAGFILRLSETLGWQSPHRAMTNLGISHGDLRWGARQRRGNSARLCGHHIPLKYLDLQHRRVCRMCLQDSRFMREWWEIAILTACPIHGNELVKNCSCGTPLTWNDTHLDGCDECQPIDGGLITLPVDAGQMEQWLLSRLKITQKRPAIPELDTGDLSLALRILENVGLLGQSGFTEVAPLRVDSHAAGRQTLAEGLELLRGVGLEDHIERSVVAFRESSGIDVPKTPADGLGWFGDWMLNEELPGTHPFVVRVLAALQAAYGFPIISLDKTGVMAVSVLAQELGEPEEMALQRVQNQLSGKTLRGPLVPLTVAKALLNSVRGD